MAKKIKGYIKLQVEAGKANPAPPIGPALGQQGVNIMEFCKAFNAQTSANMGDLTPVVITVYEDRSFTFVTKSMPAAQQLKKAAGITKGSSTPHTLKVGKVTKAQLRDIAEKKFKDMNAASIETAMRSLAGTARSMGLDTEAL